MSSRSSGLSLSIFFFFNDTATTEIYTTANTLSLHDALPICQAHPAPTCCTFGCPFASVRARSRSEEHTSELQSLAVSSYAVFCLKKKKKKRRRNRRRGREESQEKKRKKSTE